MRCSQHNMVCPTQCEFLMTCAMCPFFDRFEPKITEEHAARIGQFLIVVTFLVIYVFCCAIPHRLNHKIDESHALLKRRLDLEFRLIRKSQETTDKSIAQLKDALMDEPIKFMDEAPAEMADKGNDGAGIPDLAQIMSTTVVEEPNKLELNKLEPIKLMDDQGNVVGQYVVTNWGEGENGKLVTDGYLLNASGKNVSFNE